MTSAMEFTNESSASPQMGSWLSEEFDQDFCYGAKVSTLQNPVFSTPPAIFTDKNEESFLNISWNELSPLETFTDVILPGNGNFDPDDLFDDFADEEKFDSLDNQSLDPNSFFLPPQTIIPKPSPPIVKIRLRRIKKLKGSKKHKNIYSQHHNKLEFEVIEPIEGINSEEFYQPQDPADFLVQDDRSYFDDPFKNKCLSPDLEERIIFEPSPGGPSNQYKNEDFEELASGLSPEHMPISFESSPEHIFFESSPAHINFASSPEETVIVSGEDSLSPIVSLRDAIDMGEADHILDDLLNGVNATDSNQLVLLDSQNSQVIPQLQNSPLSPASESSFLPSPQCDSSSYMEYSPETDYSAHSPLFSPSMELEENHLDKKDKRSTKSSQKLSQEMRYLKKKEQNKQAALRYRMKKKQQDNSLSQVLENEEEEKEKLTKEYSNLKQEIDIMKKLLREAFVAKKLVPQNFFSRKS